MIYIQEHSSQFKKASLALFFSGFVIFSNLYTPQTLLPVFQNNFPYRRRFHPLPYLCQQAFCQSWCPLPPAYRIGSAKIRHGHLCFYIGFCLVHCFQPEFCHPALFTGDFRFGGSRSAIPCHGLCGGRICTFIHRQSDGALYQWNKYRRAFRPDIDRYFNGFIFLAHRLVQYRLNRACPYRYFVKYFDPFSKIVDRKTLFGYKVHLANKPLLAIICLGFYWWKFCYII